MPLTTIERQERPGAQEFVLRIDGVRAGALEFTRPEPGILRIEYVEVAPERQGAGLGRELVDAAMTWARDEGLTVVPICSYARMVIARDYPRG